MQLLSEITVSSATINASIQLLQGDCTAIPPEHNADILVVSAFPNDYTPLPGSLMFALHEKGIDVGEMSKNKAVNLVPQLGCWMSQPLGPEQQKQLNFKQILCFEPTRQSGSPENVIGNIFRCINNFAFDDDNNVIAMPLLATGKQRVPVETMLPATLEACIFWLETGIPLDQIKLIVRNDLQAQKALPIFEAIRKAHDARQAQNPPVPDMTPSAGTSPSPTLTPTFGATTGGDAPRPFAPRPVTAPRQPAQATGIAAQPATQPAPKSVAPHVTSAPAAYDFFISYSHVHSQEVAQLVSAMKEKNGSLQIFYDRNSIPPGGAWIRQISEAIQHSASVLCILSPEYRNSDVCWDEFQCAKAKEYRTKTSVIKTINFLKDDDMPLMMSLYSYIDCTEADMAKLKEAVNVLC